MNARQLLEEPVQWEVRAKVLPKFPGVSTRKPTRGGRGSKPEPADSWSQSWRPPPGWEPFAVLVSSGRSEVTVFCKKPVDAGEEAK